MSFTNSGSISDGVARGASRRAISSDLVDMSTLPYTKNIGASRTSRYKCRVRLRAFHRFIQHKPKAMDCPYTQKSYFGPPILAAIFKSFPIVLYIEILVSLVMCAIQLRRLNYCNRVQNANRMLNMSNWLTARVSFVEMAGPQPG